MSVMEEFSQHQPIQGGVRRCSRLAHVSTYDTKVVVERWSNGRIGIVERDADRPFSAKTISLSDDEARIIRDELDRVLAAGPSRPADPEASEVAAEPRLEGSPPDPTQTSAPSVEGPSRTDRGFA